MVFLWHVFHVSSSVQYYLYTAAMSLLYHEHGAVGL
jgi:hypothetical protein